ncbi:MAG: Lipolytic protein G-D-S-L family, partial [Candidatus Woesebacteria bacterium GW2011_GWB1_45_5]
SGKIFGLIPAAAFGVWGITAFAINLASKHGGFMFIDGYSPFAEYLIEITGFNFNNYFPSFYPAMALGKWNFIILGLVAVFSFLAVATAKIKRYKILLAVLGFILSFLVLEFGFRIYYFVHERQWFGLSPVRTTLSFYDNDIFGSALSPSQEGWFVPDSKEYFTRIEVNSHGWPDVEHSYEKPDEIYRILIIGDSFVENTQVPLEKRFFRQLQRDLGQKIEVIALGRGNTGTAQQYLILKNFGLKYKPDMVIQMFFEANDVKNNSPVLQNDPYLPYFSLNENGKLTELPHGKRSERKLSVLKDLIKKFRVTEFLLFLRQKSIEKEANYKTGYPADYHVYDLDLPRDYSDAWEVTKKLLDETRKETERAGAKYMLIAFPGNEAVQKDVQERIVKTYPEFDPKKISFDRPEKILGEFCRLKKIDCRFMLSFFADYMNSNPGARLYNFYEGHWTQAGTDLTADFITEVFSSLPQFRQSLLSR